MYCLGCTGKLAVCCCGFRWCLIPGSLPLMWGCCGLTCTEPCTSLVKSQCQVACLQTTCGFPCDGENPCMCTLLPFCMVYPRVGCCLKVADVKKGAPKVEPEGGAPASIAMER